MKSLAKPTLPLVSVIIPTFNRCVLIQDAINSVLVQDFLDYEIIIVDDGSTDNTRDILIARYGDKIHYYWQENQGGPVARNLGLNHAKGKYIAFLDSDDLWAPEKLSHQVPILENNPDVSVVVCQAWPIDNTGRKLGGQPLGVFTESSDFSVENLLMYNKIPAGATTCLIRRCVLEKVGGFSQDIRFGAEWDLWLRIASDSKMFIIPEPLASYRQHKQTLSYFPEIKYVDETLADRIVMLERCRNNSPEKISRRSYSNALAYQYVRASLASFMLTEKERGIAWLNKAIELCPNFWKDKADFANQIAVFADSYSLDQNSNFSLNVYLSFVDLLCANLPESLNRKDWIRLTKGKVKVEVGFRLHKNGNKQIGIQQIVGGIFLAPQLIDLAVMAIFAELIIGRRAVNWLRSLRHKEFGRAE